VLTLFWGGECGEDEIDGGVRMTSLSIWLSYLYRYLIGIFKAGSAPRRCINTDDH
jgi:hypothetical protein